MVGDAAACQLHEPAFERTDRRVVFEVVHPLGDGENGFLNNFLRFGIVEAGLKRDAVNEFPVNIKKVAPAFLVVPFLEASYQTVPCWNKFFGIDWLAHGS